MWEPQGSHGLNYIPHCVSPISSLCISSNILVFFPLIFTHIIPRALALFMRFVSPMFVNFFPSNVQVQNVPLIDNGSFSSLTAPVSLFTSIYMRIIFTMKFETSGSTVKMTLFYHSYYVCFQNTVLF